MTPLRVPSLPLLERRETWPGDLTSEVVDLETIKGSLVKEGDDVAFHGRSLLIRERRSGEGAVGYVERVYRANGFRRTGKTDAVGQVVLCAVRLTVRGARIYKSRLGMRR